MEKEKRQIAQNLAYLRTSSGMTQAELAERMNYSDKAISKWERGESVPDVFVLKQLADLFGVTVDDLLTAETIDVLQAKLDGRGTEDTAASPDTLEESKRPFEVWMVLLRRWRAALLTVSFVWLAAVLVFVLLYERIPRAWLAFLGAIPVSGAVLLLFRSLNGNAVWRFCLRSGVIWSALTFFFLLFLPMRNWWVLFLVGVPLEGVVLLIFLFDESVCCRRKRP